MNHESNNPQSEDTELDPLQLAMQLEQASSNSHLNSEQLFGPIAALGQVASSEILAAMAGLELIRRTAEYERYSDSIGDLNASKNTIVVDREIDNRGADDAGPNGFQQSEVYDPGLQLPPTGERNVLGKFEIIRELGRGGFGVVLLGRDPHLDRLVAIKVLRPSALLDSQARQRFEREARLCSMLSHPAIVPIFESRADGPIAYIAFEYCPGKTLADWFTARGRMISPKTAARIMVQLAQAVQYAHQRGVVHRDLKPSNILLKLEAEQATDENDVVEALRITDFGLSRSVLQSADCLTRDGAIVGTPAYMAPEQATGKLELVGKSADIYSLGAILYQLLTGQPPFMKESDLATLRAVESLPPTPLRRLRREIPSDLEAICLKCLEKEPRRRYDSAYSLFCDLERFLGGTPVLARRTSLLESSWRWTGRHRALTAAMVLLLIGLIATSWQWWRAEYHVKQANRYLSESQSQYARAERNLHRTEQAIDSMLTEVADTLQHVPQMESLRNRLLQRALELQQQMAIEESAAPEVLFRTAVSQRRMGQLMYALGEFDSAQTAISTALSKLDALEDDIDPFEWWCERGRLDGVMFEIKRSANDANASLEFATHAVNAWRQAAAIQPHSSVMKEDYLLAIRHYGIGLEKQRSYGEAKFAFEEALKLATEVPISERSEKIEILRGQLSNSLGVLYSTMGDADQSESHYLQAIDIFLPVVKNRPERVDLGYSLAITSFNLGNRHARRRAHDQAITHYARAHELLSKLVVSFPANVAYRQDLFRVASGWATSQFRLGNPHAAAQLLEESLASQQLLPVDVRLSPSAINDQALALLNLGNVYLEGLDSTDRAMEHYQSALELREEQRSRSPTSIEALRGISVCKGNMAACFMKQDPQQAITRIVEALEVAEEACSLDSSNKESQSNAAFQINQLVAARWQLRDVERLLSELNLYASRFNLANRRLHAVRLIATCIQQISETSERGTEVMDSTAPPTVSTIDEERLRDAAFTHLALALENGESVPDDLLLQAPFSALSGDDRFASLLNKP